MRIRAAVWLGVVLLAACGGSDPAPGDLDAVTPDAGPDGGGQDDAGTEPGSFAEAERTALQAILEDYIRFSGDPGTAMAIHDGTKRWWSGVAGSADLLAGKPVTDRSQFRVGSNTKPIVSAWILQLAEEGLVDLDASITEYLPAYPQWKDVTVRHCLGMQSGIVEFLNAPSCIPELLAEPWRDYTPAEVVAYVKDMALEFAPGQGCKYSNTNYTLAGMIGEKVTGRTAVEELRDRFFVPLGMKDTYLEVTGDPQDRVVHGYMDLAVLIPLMKLPPLIVGLFPSELFVGDTLVVDGTTLLPPSLTWTAGSLVSTPSDLAIFQRAFQGGRLVGPAMMAEMRKTTSCELLGGTVQYGLGMMESQSPIGKVYGHGGLNFGFHVETYYHPDLDAAFCHMHNFLPAQVVTMSDQAVRVALLGGEGVPPPCDVPGSIFADAPPAAPYLKLLFKGPVGDGSGAKDQAGMGSVWHRIGTEWIRLYGIDRLGIYAGATRTEVDGKDTLTLTAWGPSDRGDNLLRQLRMTIETAVLDRAGADGVVTLGVGDVAQVFPTVIDHTLDADLKVTMSCVVAVPDLLLPSRLYLCDGAESAAAGKMLRMAAALGLTADTATIETTLGAVGMPRCTCLDAAQQPIACPAS